MGDTIESLKQEIEILKGRLSPGQPDPLLSPMAEAIRAGYYDDTEFRSLFDRMECELVLLRFANSERIK